jgi:hypothetical protein
MMSSLLFFSPVLAALIVGVMAQREKGRTGALYWLITVVLGYLIATYAIPTDAQMIAMGHRPMDLDELRWPIGGVAATIFMIIVVATLPNRSAARTKKCPHCAEDIQLGAKICKHCGRNVERPA